MAWRFSFPQVWNSSQRSGLAAILLVLAGCVCLELWIHPAFVPDPQPAVGPRAGELADQVDLNTADAATLAAIPKLGQKKADAVVAYREQFQSKHPGRRAFDRIEDLYRIKGIGPATVAQLRQYVQITRPSTQP